MQKRFMYIAILLLAICNKIVAEDLITISDIIMYSGGTKEVNVVMTNTDSYVGFQFDMVLPEGITVESFSASERIPQGTSLQMAQQTDGSYRFIAYAQNRLPITGNDGAIMTLTIKASESVVSNSYSGYLRNVKISKADGSGVTKAEQPFAITVQGAEAYAVLSEGNTTLTFYYDKKKDERNGMSVGPFTGYTQRGWHSVRSSIIQVVFDDSFASYSPTSTALWFWGLQAMTSIQGIENLHTDQVTDMNGMFNYCYALEVLDLSNFNTANVTNIAGMFYGCNKLKSIFVGEGWSIDKIITTTISGTGGNGGWQVFSQCTSLVGGAGTTFDANHTDYTYAHIDGGPSNPGYLTEKLDYNDGDLFTAKTIEGVTLTFVVTNASEKKCFVASNDRNTYMDTSTTGVVTIPSIARGYTVEALSNGAFKGCASVTEFKLPETLVLIECDAFRNCTGLTTVHIPASVTGIENQPLPWPGCTGITSITVDPENPIFDSRDNCNAIFTTADSTLYVGCKVSTIPESTRSIGHSAFDSMGELPALVLPAGLRSITAYAFWACSFPSVTSYIEEPFETSCVWDHLPEECPLYVPKGKVDAYRALSEWNNFTTIVEIGSSITPEPYAVLSEDSLTVTFYYDDQKTSRGGMDINNSILDNSNSPYGTATSAVFDVSFDAYRPTSTACWFENCSSLATINGIEYLHTDDVTNMSWMFECCFNLEELDLSNFNTSNVTEMYGMFLSCQGLKSLNVSSFNTSKVVGMNQMFCGLSNLTNLDLSNFDTSNVRWMYAMFADCPNLTSLDISSFNSALVSNMGDLFSNCVKLKTIYVGDGWATTGVEENGDHVFDNCPSLVGGMGTVYDANRTDYTYAHIDGGVSNPGYFTDINGSTLNDGDTFTAVNSDGIKLRYRVISATDKTCQVGDKADSNTLSPDDIASAVDTTVVGIINVPEQANGYKVVRVGYQAFVNCRNVTEVVLPNTVTELYLYSFAYSGIKRFTLPRSVSIIHYAALTETDSLETIIVDSENPVFDSRNNCNAIIETASNTLVRGCITSFVPDGITAIGSGAFLSCCAHDWTIELPNSVTRIETQAFNSCDLTDIKLPNNLQYVGYSAFGGSKLTSVVVPASVTEMGIGAFRVNSLTSLVVDEANSVFDSRDNCNAIIETATNTLVCGSNVTIIPNSVTAIGRYAFSELWNLKTITLPSSITRIDDHAFWFSNLETIISLIEKPFEISDNVFREDVYKRCALYVPSGTVDAYRSTSGWNLFQNILEINPSHGEPEPYAVLSDNNTVLTFYYDNKKEERNGMSVGPFRHWTDNSWYEFRKDIINVVFNESFAACDTIRSTAYWFYECNNLTSILGIENLKTNNVTSMTSMFFYCSNLENIDVSGFKTSNVTSLGGMFQSCSKLQSIDVSGFDTGNTVFMYQMFRDCSNLTNIDVSGFNTENVQFMFGMFSGCSSLTNIDVRGFETKNVTDIYAMFSNCNNLTNIDVSGFNTANVTSLNSMFSRCHMLTNIDVSGFNTEKVTDMSNMFLGCEIIDSLDLSHFNTSNVIDMNSMFASCSSLRTINVSGFNTAKVTSMEYMFNSCDELLYLDVSNFNTANVTSMDAMFAGCSKLTNLDLSKFNTENVSNMEWMFASCSSLKTLDVSSFNTNHVTNMYSMFRDCSSLTVLDLSSFKTPNVIVTDAMFANCTSLKTIYGSNWDMSKVTGGSSMFANCTSLVGGAGTVYTHTAQDQTYARIDGGPSNPGYFTDKNAQADDGLELYAIDVESEMKSNETFMPTQSVKMTLGNDSEWSTNNDLAPELGGELKFDANIYYPGIYNKNYAFVSSVVGTNNPAAGPLVDGMSTGSSYKPRWRNLPESGAYFIFESEQDGSLIVPIRINPNKPLYVTDDAGVPLIAYQLKDQDGVTVALDANSSTAEKTIAFLSLNVSKNQKYYIFCKGSKPRVGGYIFAPHTIDIDPATTAAALDSLLAEPVDATFDSNGVLSVGGGTTMADALEYVGGRGEVAKTITAIVWNSTATLTNDDLQGLDNPNMLIYVKDAASAPANRDNVVISGMAKNIVLTDVSEGNGNFYCPRTFKAEMVSYTHEYRQQTEIGVSRGWETIALPFTVQTIMHEKNGLIAPFGNTASSKHFWLREMTPQGLGQATVISANMPYLISMPNNSVAYPAEFNLNGRVTFSSQDVDVVVTDIFPAYMQSEGGGMLMFAPCFKTLEPRQDAYALNVGEQRGHYLEGSVFESNYRAIRPFEAFTIHEGNSPAPQFIPVSDMNVGITDIGASLVNSEEANSEKWYDLNGRRLQQKPTQKGVYILNGKKTVVK